MCEVKDKIEDSWEKDKIGVGIGGLDEMLFDQVRCHLGG
jgi:hypothetical protein